MTTKMNELLAMTGDFGRWHWLVLFVGAFQGILLLFQDYALAFAGAVPDHWCYVHELKMANWSSNAIKWAAIPRENIDVDVENEWNHCEMWNRNYTWLIVDDNKEDETWWRNNTPSSSTSKWRYDRLECPNGWEYDTSAFKTTITGEWDLVCDRLPLLSTTQSMYMVGALVGSLVFGPLSDKFGRRPAALWASGFVIFGAMSSAFSFNYFMFVVSRFLVGVGAIGVYTCTYVIVAELSPNRLRFITTFVFDVFPDVGKGFFGLMGYYFREWRHLLLAFAIADLFYLIYFWILPESPRWLLVKGRFDEAEKVLRTAARWNGKELPPSETLHELMTELRDTELRDEIHEKNITADGGGARMGNGTSHHEPPKRNMSRTQSWIETSRTVLMTLLIFVRTPEMRKRSLAIFFSWFVAGLVNFGMGFNFAKLPFNPFLSHVINGCLLTLATILSLLIPLPDLWGRRPSYILTFLLGGAAGLLIIAVPPEITWLAVSLTLGCSMILSVPLTIIYLYTAELFPTEIRNAAIGTGSVCSRVGGIVAPFLVELLGTYHHAIPSAIFGGFAVAAGGVCLVLPETLGTRLPETVEEVEEWQRKGETELPEELVSVSSSRRESKAERVKEERV